MEVLPAGQKMARLHMVDFLRLRLQMQFYSSLNYSGIIRLLSIDRTNFSEHSYQSLANQFFESTPDSLTVHSTCLRTLGIVPGQGS